MENLEVFLYRKRIEYMQKLKDLQEKIQITENEQPVNDDKNKLENVIWGMKLQHEKLSYANYIIRIELIDKIILLRQYGHKNIPVYSYLRNQLVILAIEQPLNPNVLLPVTKVIKNISIEQFLTSISDELNDLITKLPIDEYKRELEEKIGQIVAQQTVSQQTVSQQSVLQQPVSQQTDKQFFKQLQKQSTPRPTTLHQLREKRGKQSPPPPPHKEEPVPELDPNELLILLKNHPETELADEFLKSLGEEDEIDKAMNDFFNKG